MDLYTLYTYCGINELRRIQDERDVYPFAFERTKDMLDCNSDVCIDITALVYLLQTYKHNILTVQANLQEMTENTVVIVDEVLAESALKFLPFLFYECKEYYRKTEKREEAESSDVFDIHHCSRRPIYKYNSFSDLDEIIRYTTFNNIPISTFASASGELRGEFEQFNRSAKMALLDLTSLSYAIEDNKNYIYILELFLTCFPNISIIAQTSQVDVLLKYFPLFFEDQEPIHKLLPEISNISEEPEKNPIIKVTSLSGNRFNSFIESFNHNLIGHEYFKKRMRHSLKNFISLNKAREQKVLSIFLFGASGIGKTEVARLLANGLQEDSYLAKINFQNYSSQDAINSLIGSPAGYVGCNHGELSEKIQKSKVGILLCDEFEKTTRPVFSFFLELLEEGHFTDSMAREYDMDGYVIVFTSNIRTEAEYKKTIPPELQTRFDLVCEFEEPELVEKTMFLDLLLEKAQAKYPEQFSRIQMTENNKRKLYAFDYSGLSALRDIKRAFNNRLMDFFAENGIDS